MPITRTPRRTSLSGRTRPGIRVRHLLSGSAALLVASLLAGCGGSSHHAAVASLPTHHGAAEAGGASAISNTGIPDPQGRPRQSLDATSRQETDQTQPYWHCMSTQHLHVSGGPQVTRAELACRRLYPLPPWQFDPANPQARAFVGRVVTCLEGRGLHARAALTSQGPLGDYWAIAFAPSVTTASPNGTAILEHRADVQTACESRAQA